MKAYYYSTSDTVYDSWSDSDLKRWLVDHDIIKSNAQVTREKMLKMIQSVSTISDYLLILPPYIRSYYISANDTFWNAWSDSQIHSWLIDHGYLRSDAQVQRDELVKLANEKYERFPYLRLLRLTFGDLQVARCQHEDSSVSHLARCAASCIPPRMWCRGEIFAD